MTGDDAERGKKSPYQDDEGFLGRWSRRKSEARTAEPIAAADVTALDDVDKDEKVPDPLENGEPQAFDVESLPDIDSLGPGSDFSVFMQAGVPPALKTKALRKLWRVRPELANLDGLIDYGEDLTGSFKVVDQLKTAYEVGRGFLRDEADKVPAPGEEVASNDDPADGERPTEPEEGSAEADGTDKAPTDESQAADEQNAPKQTS